MKMMMMVRMMRMMMMMMTVVMLRTMMMMMMMMMVLKMTIMVLMTYSGQKWSGSEPLCEEINCGKVKISTKSLQKSKTV